MNICSFRVCVCVCVCVCVGGGGGGGGDNYCICLLANVVMAAEASSLFVGCWSIVAT